MARALEARHAAPVLAGAGFALAGAVAAHREPVAALGIGIAVVLAGMGLLLPGKLSRLFAGGMAVLLVGYAFFGRPFAYLGVPPHLYVGEMVLGLGLLAAVLSRDRAAALRSPVAWLMLAFMVWGATLTFTGFAEHGADALRDGVIWGYAIFAFLAVPLLLRDRAIHRLPGWFGRVLPFFLVWAPLGLGLRYLVGGALPRVPGSDVGLLAIKPGDLGTHLGGAAAFLLVGRIWWTSLRAGDGTGLERRREWLLWGAWTLGFLAAASINRGGMLAGLAAIGVVLLLRPIQGTRRLITTGGVLLATILTIAVLDLSVDRGPGDRSISPAQIVANTVSLVDGASSGDGFSGTAEWRLDWWRQIVDYTFHGEHFWTGKGFGINLTVADGIRTSREDGNRNPHSGHFTVLARSGVPGLGLWIALQLGFAVLMLVGHFRARREEDGWWAGYFAWVLAYWTAFIVNMSFDVFLEGPQGGIWFWSLMGAGIAGSLARVGRR